MTGGQTKMIPMFHIQWNISECNYRFSFIFENSEIQRNTAISTKVQKFKTLTVFTSVACKTWLIMLIMNIVMLVYPSTSSRTYQYQLSEPVQTQRGNNILGRQQFLMVGTIKVWFWGLSIVLRGQCWGHLICMLWSTIMTDLSEWCYDCQIFSLWCVKELVEDF